MKLFLVHAAEALRVEMLSRPIIRERVMRFLNNDNQRKLTEHLISGIAQKAYTKPDILAPWGCRLSRMQAFDFVIAVLESEKKGSPMLEEAEYIMRRIRDSMEYTQSAVTTIDKREEFWRQVRERWNRERDL